MKRIQLHPFSLVVGGCVTAAAVLLMAGGKGGPGFNPVGVQHLAILNHMRLVHLDDGQGGTVETIRITGANLQIVNGLDDTETNNGLGNLIVGYNALGNRVGDDRTGSHNIAVGNMQNYRSYGGLIAGFENDLSEKYTSVTGGRINMASAAYASVTGGELNVASGLAASVTAGQGNSATAPCAAVSGGQSNIAGSDWTSVTGGQRNVANATRASVTGGQNNSASGFWSSIGGGNGGQVTGPYDWMAGTCYFCDD